MENNKKNKKGKKNFSKFREYINDSLEDLLKNNINEELQDIVDDGKALPKVYVPEQHDYKKIKEKSIEKAKKTLDALMKFYLSEDIINNEEYLISKKNMDIMTLSSLIFQLEAGEKALITLLNTINTGELSPRMFEVLANLQKSILDIIKSQTMYLIAAEESIKKLSRDLEVYKGLKQLPTSNNQIAMGTKMLMQNIQNEIQMENQNNLEKNINEPDIIECENTFEDIDNKSDINNKDNDNSDIKYKEEDDGG